MARGTQVNELKQELEARGQTSKGLKSQLQARLQKLLKGEEDAEGANKTDGEAAEDAMDADKEVPALTE
jgi:SAP domain